jgi:hypothetical protein
MNFLDERNEIGKTMTQTCRDLDVLLERLRCAQADYDWARSRGDAERAAQVRIKLQSITAEHDRLIHRMISSSALPRTA